MNPRAFDLILRSVTTALLALGFLIIVAINIWRTGTIDDVLLALAGPVFGAYVGAHVSQNGAAARGRVEQIAAAEAVGEPPPRDPLMPVRPPKHHDGG